MSITSCNSVQPILLSNPVQKIRDLSVDSIRIWLSTAVTKTNDSYEAEPWARVPGNQRTSAVSLATVTPSLLGTFRNAAMIRVSVSWTNLHRSSRRC